jgi:F-type H+-transporting ATPase subunit epsilon
MSFHFRIITPERVLSEEDVDSVSLPAADGQVTVHTHHTAYVGLLQPGVVYIRRAADAEGEEVAISGGFAKVEEGGKTLTLLVETAEKAQELDAKVIEAAQARAKQVMESTAKYDDASFAAAAAALQREMARARVVGRSHTRRLSSLPMTDKSAIRKDENAS